MVNVEMVLLVLMALVGLVLLALAVASGPVSHMDTHEGGGRRAPSPPARPWSGTPSMRRAPSPRRSVHDRRAAPGCTRSSDWARLMEPTARHGTPSEAER
jgi:hypothetical protein